jgi:hypothetical protein
MLNLPPLIEQCLKDMILTHQLKPKYVNVKVGIMFPLIRFILKLEIGEKIENQMDRIVGRASAGHKLRFKA